MGRKEIQYQSVVGYPIPRLFLGTLVNFSLLSAAGFAGLYEGAALKNHFLSVLTFSLATYLGARLWENVQNLNTVWIATHSLSSSDPKQFDVTQESVSPFRKIIWPARYRARQRPF